MEHKIDIGKQPRSVMRVLNKFTELTEDAHAESGRLDLYRDGLPLVVSAIIGLYPKMRLSRRLELASQVFKIIERMHMLALGKMPTEMRQ